MEKWLPIIGFEGLYEVSNLGNVRSLIKDVIKPIKSALTKNGYETVMLYNNTSRKNITIHRLLAIAFIPNPENKKTVNHINGIKTDNRLENLEWATYIENNRHAFKSGLNKGDGWLGKFGKDHSKSKAVEFINENGVVIYSFESARIAERQTGHKNATISAQCIGKNKSTHTVNKWRFANAI